MFRYALILGVLIFVVSCLGESSLRGTHWNLVSMDTYEGPDIPAVDEVTLAFSDGGNDFKGDTGCNSYGGRTESKALCSG